MVEIINDLLMGVIVIIFWELGKYSGKYLYKKLIYIKLYKKLIMLNV